ncbi:mannosyl-oligosaccharide glucosidase [Wickerhamomyces ciferrii]|uniref:Mannosyl-oligosaccharide glucosidase n=1 Tax=Wickerhamomyces ciferrii (strain ATCC 14091 / BCRC 22168 / CBS 111 / JCM 3599 / NBRC 0793 / NRRL Y-1031 F-60-10) TaxID=1206466 RepID=K0KEY9_WICCF|nr:mannosyl-oligosaccharide glucosidase [Wickerhamomyces ciferrii]CCH41521.1 mannosyl-oligosaccharide glucosidase [Wickerhamomyces ciferrii]
MLRNLGLLVVFLSVLANWCLAVEDKDQLIKDYEKYTKQSLLWGPYRPGNYLGIRPRIPHSLMAGLFWFNADNIENIHNIRHVCDQGQDFNGFGWSQYDPRIGGKQIFHDNELKLDLTTDFIKNKEGSWAIKVKGVPRPGYEKNANSIVFYAGLEGEGMLTSAVGAPSDGFKRGDPIKLIGQSDEFQGFEIDINDGPNTNQHKFLNKKQIADPDLNPSRTHYVSMRAPNDNVWKAKDIFNVLISESVNEIIARNPDTKNIPHPSSLLTLRNLNGFEGNLHFIQKTFVGAFEFDITFNLEESSNKIEAEDLDLLINQTLTKFDAKFNKVLDLQPPFNNAEYKKFSEEFISNLMGGIGYFHGDHLVDRETEFNEEKYEPIQLEGKPEGPFELFSSVPSRTFFPRGFYWDEGFQLIPILEYDTDLVLEILKSWFNLIDDDGWIAREQILGPEARSRVPSEFQVQNPNIANPPTLMLLFTDLLKKAKETQDSKDFSFGDIDEPERVDKYGDIDFTDITDAHLRYPELLINYAENIYPKLQSHYEWFKRTQKGELEEFEREPFSPNEAYRWKGRTFTHNLASGLDDYPRALPPDIAELNVDLISWVGTMTRSMKQIAELLGKTEDAAKYSKIEYDIQRNIEDLHWSKKDKTYCDVSVDQTDRDVFYCAKGYISLFPFTLKLIEPGSEHIRDIIELIADPEELWSQYGIRSLSKSNEFYRTHEQYWRGPVWININYLVLDSLLHYGTGENGAKLDPETWDLANKTYTELRRNVVENVYKQWKSTGFAYEQYDDQNGKPRGAKHFLGWTGLVTVMMKMPESLK